MISLNMVASSVAVLGFALGQFGLEQEGVGTDDALVAGQSTEDLDAVASTAPGQHRLRLEAAVDGNEHRAAAIKVLHRIGGHAERTVLAFAKRPPAWRGSPPHHPAGAHRRPNR
ncbi:hypothetical protein G6F65_016405 [Rhizopus arrhizus]|nr:hypothetical protein G6F65_016405 [Rhizopus arrhizus]